MTFFVSYYHLHFLIFIYAFYLNLEGGNWLMLPGSHNLSFIPILNMPEMDSSVVINWCYLYFYIYSFFQHWLKILTFTGVLQKHIEILKRSNITQVYQLIKNPRSTDKKILSLWFSKWVTLAFFKTITYSEQKNVH